MKTKEKKKKTLVGVWSVFLLCILVHFVSCKPEVENGRVIAPPDPNRETTITSYYPDSGGVATKIILRGTNFGTDTSYLKVTVNEKKAAIIGVDGEALCAIVPARADTGLVQIFVGKGDNQKVFTYDNEFKYFFMENVTTVAGQNGQKGTADGNAATVALLQRPWFITFDSDGTLYFIDEGRGLESNGGLRKYSATYNSVETIMRNSSGPMQSPTALAFSLAQDTLFLLNSLWNENSMNTKATVAYLTRNEGFSVIKPYATEPVDNARATALAVHPKTGDVYFNSQNTGYIYRFDKVEGKNVGLFMVNEAKDTELKMNFSMDGNTLYIMVKNKHCIFRSIWNESTNQFSTPELWVGTWDASGCVNAMGHAARFNEPAQGTCDEYGNVYVADKKNHCIRKIDKTGLVSTYAGVAGTSGYKDGLPLESLFNQPECVTRAPDGGLYVADRDNHLLRKIMVE